MTQPSKETYSDLNKCSTPLLKWLFNHKPKHRDLYFGIKFNTDIIFIMDHKRPLNAEEVPGAHQKEDVRLYMTCTVMACA